MSSPESDEMSLSLLAEKKLSLLKHESDDETPLASLQTESPKKKTKKRAKNGDSAAELQPKKKAKSLSKSVKRETEVAKNGKKKLAAKDASAKKTTKKTKAVAAVESSQAKSESPAPSQDGEAKAEEDSEDYKWWEDEKFGSGEERWQLLEHNGVIFPPPYEPLPSYVKLYYNGKPVNLPPAAEEVAGFFGAMVETDHAKNPVFQNNFFKDFLEVLKENGGCNVKIEKFEHCDFLKMHAYFEKQKEEKKAMTAEQKRRIKEEREKLEEPYKTCLLNGRRENVGNFKIEPPGLFRGRGAHPKTGKLKKRVSPEEITLNLGKDAPIPPAPEGHLWGAIKHDQSVVWLATWKENVLDSIKYVKLAANSSIKGISDMKKFEKARELHKYVDKIRTDYRKMFKDQFMRNRQMAVATYLIDVFALRAGGEKGDDEADTVGCCSLRYEHVTLKPPSTVIFDFLGKDSIRFYQEVEVDRQVFKNLRIFKKEPKQPGDDLFDRITPALLNKHLQNYMKGLTAKVFRTYNASKTMQDQMDLIKNEGTVQEKVTKYNAANRTVAILCNHQRTVTKGHQLSVEKIKDKIREMEWQKLRLKRMMLQVQPGLKNKQPEYFAEMEDMPKEELLRIIHAHIDMLKDRAKKKWQRTNDKRKMEKQEPLGEDELNKDLQKADVLQKKYEAEVASGKIADSESASLEKLQAQVTKMEERITNTSLQLKDKEDNSEVSLGTSKLNYIDPRLTVMFAKKFNVPIERLFTKTLRDKFNWAIESADENWRF